MALTVAEDVRFMAEGFAAVPTAMLRDESVSIYAVMVYAVLASYGGYEIVAPKRETIAKFARCSVRKVADALNELEALGVLERERRTNSRGQATTCYVLITGRRAVKAHGAPTGSVKAHGALGGGTSEQVTPIYTNRESEIDRLSGSPEPNPRNSRGTYLPDDWVPSQKHHDLAASFGSDINREALRFREHAHRVKRRQIDWHGAFTNWLRKGAEMSQQRAVAGGQVRAAGTAVERMAARARAIQPEGVQRELGA